MGDDLIERLKATEGHTRGPWRIRRNRSHNLEECDLTICGDIFLLADVNGPNYSHCEPNARLLALAPEMKARILSDATDLLAARVTVACRSMTVAELIAAHERAVEALHSINNLASAYSEKVFTPLTDDEVDKIVSAMSAAVRNGSDRMHASWGRHLMALTGEIAREGLCLAALPAPPAPSETEGA